MDDSIWILNQEIQSRKEGYEAEITQLTEKRDRLLSELNAVRESHSTEMSTLTSRHEAELAQLQSFQTELMHQVTSDHESRKEIALNRALADRLLYESECDDEMQRLTAEIQSLQASQQASQSSTMEEADAKLLTLRSQIHVSRTRVQDLQNSITKLTIAMNSNLHRGPRATPYDKEIKRCKDEMTDMSLHVTFHRDKQDDQFRRSKQLNKFELRKLRQEIQVQRERAQDAQQRIDETDVVHKARMRKLRKEVLKLTTPTAIQAPNQRKISAIKKRVSLVALTIQQNTEELLKRRPIHQKMKARNEKLTRELRRRKFIARYQ
jgi:hypothetical protein